VRQLSFLDSVEDHEWDNDNWQTPSKIAKSMADLVQAEEYTILEPCAGTGQIVAEILKLSGKSVYANEINGSKCLRARANYPRAFWSDRDFLRHQLPFSCSSLDLIITNPPFSLAVDFIGKSLELIKREGRLLFLLPLDWNCAKGRAKEWKKLDAHIRHVYRIEGRVGYLGANGVAQNGRQCCDAVFDIRLGRNGATTTYLGEPHQESKKPFYFSTEPPF